MSGNVSTPAAPAEPLALAIAGFRRDETLWPRQALQRDRVQQFLLLYREGGETCNLSKFWPNFSRYSGRIMLG
jgi:hypothetical protein